MVNPDSVPELYNALVDLVQQVEAQEKEFENQPIEIDISTGRAHQAIEWAREGKV